MKAEDYTGPGTFTGFLKEVVRRRLVDQLKIDPADYVSEKFTEKQRINRQMKRGKFFPAIVSPDIEDPASIDEQNIVTEAPVEPQVSVNEEDSASPTETATEKTQIETTSNTVEDEANTNNSNTKIYLSSVIF